MTPSKGVADDQLGRYFRKMNAIADRLGKSLDTHQVLYLLQRIHDGEQFLGRQTGQPVLALAGTFEVPAIERVVPKLMFGKVRLSPSPIPLFKFGSGDVWLHCHTSRELFENIFLHGKNGKLEKNIAPTTLRIHKFNWHGGPTAWERDSPVILAELGQRHTVMLGHIWYLLELDAQGKPNPLLTKGERNLFYVHGRDGALYGFKLTKSTLPPGKGHGGWDLWVYSTAQPNNYCYGNDQIIST